MGIYMKPYLSAEDGSRARQVKTSIQLHFWLMAWVILSSVSRGKVSTRHHNCPGISILAIHSTFGIERRSI